MCWEKMQLRIDSSIATWGPRRKKACLLIGFLSPDAWFAGEKPVLLENVKRNDYIMNWGSLRTAPQSLPGPWEMQKEQNVPSAPRDAHEEDSAEGHLVFPRVWSEAGLQAYPKERWGYPKIAEIGFPPHYLKKDLKLKLICWKKKVIFFAHLGSKQHVHCIHFQLQLVQLLHPTFPSSPHFHGALAWSTRRSLLFPTYSMFFLQHLSHSALSTWNALCQNFSPR